MTDIDAVEERLRAVERAVADGDVDADLTDPTGELEGRIDDLEATTTELESGLQAVRGYVSRVKSVDDEIERRADAAAAAVDDAEARIDALERRLDGGDVAGDCDAGGDDARASDADGGDGDARDGDTGGRRRDRRRGDRPKRRRRSRPGSASRRPTEPPSHPQHTRQPVQDAATEHYDPEHRGGCPYCGGPENSERDAGTQRSSYRDGAGGDGAPVDDVDERGVVARLRDAL